MNFIYHIIIIWSGLVNYAAPVHDFHLSVIDITAEDHNTIELSIKVFFDDLLSAVGLEVGEELPDNYTSADDLLQEFVDQNLTIHINDSIVEPIYQENISSTPAVWIYYKIEDIPSDIQNIRIQNNILIDQFDDQLNMINIDIKDKEKSVALDGKTTSVTFSY